MNFLDRLRNAVRAYRLPEKMSSDPSLAAYFGHPTSTGASITEWSALNYSAFWRAVWTISDSVASLPLFLYRRLGEENGREKFTTHPLFRILHDDFSPEFTSFQARRAIQAHALTWGNGYAEIQRNVAGAPVGLWPITPDRVMPDRNPDGALVYRVHVSSGPEVRLDAENVLHIRGPSYDGLVGYSVVGKARESLGLSVAMQQYGARFFANGAIASLVVKHPGTLSAQASENIKKSIADATTGDKQWSVLLLEEAMEAKEISIPPDDAQFLESRKFQTLEIARWFNVPPHMLMDLERATFSNIEHQSLEFVQNCLRPWLVTWESELNRKLIRPLERQIQFTEHLIDGLLRGDLPSRYSAYAVGKQWGFLNTDEIRAKENLNPLPNGLGKMFLVPANMVPADQIEELTAAPPEPAQAPQPEPTPSPARAEDVTALAETMRAELAALRATVEALPAPPDITGLEGRLAALTMERDELQRESVSMIVGGLVRREFALVRECAAELDVGKLEKGYKRIAHDGITRLERFDRDGRARVALEAALVAGCDAACAALVGNELEELWHQWTDRHDAMTTALLEALCTTATAPRPESVPSASSG